MVRKASLCKGCKEGSMILAQGDFGPFFVCDHCGAENRTWEKFFTEYLLLYRDMENWEQPKHKTSCLLGFFMYQYQKKYGVEYALIPQNPNPFSSKEVVDLSRILATFGGDAKEVARYIKWVFDKKIRESTKLTSIAYFKAPDLVRKFKLMRAEKKKQKRSEGLPRKLVEWIQKEVPEVLEQYEMKTLNDLYSLKNFVATYDLQDGPEIILLDKAKEFGLGGRPR